jgi:hypothetical protein
MQATREQRDRTYKLFSRLGKRGGTLGCGWPGITHKEPPCRSKSARRRGEQERNQRPGGWWSTQRGDPAPGPMRCGTTASGDERMHQ